jgi:hypothetical protein
LRGGVTIPTNPCESTAQGRHGTSKPATYAGHPSSSKLARIFLTIDWRFDAPII